MVDERQIGGDDLVRALTRWAADQRVVEAAAWRTRERSLRDQAGASATFVGVLVDLAERGADVIVGLAGGRRSGHLVGVGRDFCVLEQRIGRPAILALAAITSVRSVGTAPVSDSPAGDRAPALELSLAAALGALADERAPVGLYLGADETVDGQLIAAGQDVVTLRTAARVVYVPLGAVMVCELR